MSDTRANWKTFRDEPDSCPICAQPFKPDDLCSTDIELGICHAECLKGSPTVNLDTGEPVDGPIPTYRFGEETP